MKSYTIEKPRHLVLRAAAGDTLPADLARVLSEEGVKCGWFRASGVLTDVELRVFDASRSGLGVPRKIAGPVQALSIEGSVGLDGGEPSVGLRAVLVRETDRGMEVLAGEIVTARVVALEAYATGFDDLSIGRALDPQAHVMLFGSAADARYKLDEERAAPAAAPAPPAVKSAPAVAPSPGAWTEAISASTEQEVVRSAANRGALGGAMPARPVRVQREYDEELVPEAGDVVEHFAFGRAEVVKSEGDRLHLRADKDSRIREIALEMLKVTPLESTGTNRRFRLDRKI